ncbi:MAG: hypothetical protein Q3M24_13260 [Candidatus Electrothrix aestuarii]|uniref:Uncharacterized protein n=1 Tax=Candidatus Electrothrix aestuarii TaxID=3062594 RepID=A0AAU8LQ04_9BACT|nr:hypothetical protein [Candidatus Electrothrix aestuarii]
MKQKRYRIAALSLLLSCLSLMLAIISPCLISQKIREIETIDRVDSATVSLEIEGVREEFVSQGDLTSKKIIFTKNEQNIKWLRRLAAVCTGVMVLTALIAIGMAVYSWDKKHGKEISIGSIITAVVALSWQYIGAGVSAGVAVLVFIMLVASLS